MIVRNPKGVVLGDELLVPMFAHAICAGFPSPADDFLEDAVDVARLLITNAPATFLWRVDGASMTGVGIFDRDILVVDRSLEPRDGDVVVAIVDGERSLKRLTLGARPNLAFANSRMPVYELPDLVDVEIWGVVTWNLHRLRAIRR
ncbi:MULTISPECIES: LexA family protein [Hansschlegelia]|uniref:Translesion error-prone DNA polymerase V autoproteolytic subunit n=1 Tax=Hansschlegelia zhihuaiae TaxID=405005 RepID=A0A4Q0MDJ5_9HYPH|nr:translesion error-prone DNA polymerase V autoproteolytic subunit [Hansschlegelia zhihuaiae]RXF71460.1 translesion error-prone DNA polymerase V autoproteolytic subunit [Hansschlegelia zhihuaiae]